MFFNPEQSHWLNQPLDPARVAGRKQGGSTVSYIEAHDAIRWANLIFGFGRWQRNQPVFTEVMHESYTKDGREMFKVGYTCSLSVTVWSHDGAQSVTTWGTGYGDAITSESWGKAHEGAIKEAETDAMKRALIVMGDQFGLALYDKTKEHVGRPEGYVPTEEVAAGPDPKGEDVAEPEPQQEASYAPGFHSTARTDTPVPEPDEFDPPGARWLWDNLQAARIPEPFPPDTKFTGEKASVSITERLWLSLIGNHPAVVEEFATVLFHGHLILTHINGAKLILIPNVYGKVFRHWVTEVCPQREDQELALRTMLRSWVKAANKTPAPPEPSAEEAKQLTEAERMQTLARMVLAIRKTKDLPADFKRDANSAPAIMAILLELKRQPWEEALNEMINEHVAGAPSPEQQLLELWQAREVQHGAPRTA